MTPNGQQNENSDEKKVSSTEMGLENAGRRRFARTGVAASGIIATLTGRPVLATVCKSPSGFLSGNLSRPAEGPCAGRSPGYWKNKTDWPISNRDTAKFKSVFTVSPGTPYFTVTMLTLLYPQDFDKYNLGMHLVAAYLNYRQGSSPFLDTSRLQAMWTELTTVGYFTPTAGVQWTAEQVVDYIKQTFN